MILRKYRNLLIVLSSSFIIIFTLLACSNRTSDGVSSVAISPERQTRSYWMQQTNVARVSQIQAAHNPQVIKTLATPNAVTSDFQLTPNQKPSAIGSQTQSFLTPSGSPLATQSMTYVNNTPSSTATLVNTQLPFQTAMNTLTPTNRPTNTATLKPTSTTIPSITSTPEVTSTLQSGWEGTWTAYVEQADGSYKVGLLLLSSTDENFIANVNIDNESLVFNGEFLGNLNNAVGTWTSQTSSGNFYWKYMSNDQFKGNMGSGLAFCAARNGALQPDPCFYAPED